MAKRAGLRGIRLRAVLTIIVSTSNSNSHIDSNNSNTHSSISVNTSSSSNNTTPHNNNDNHGPSVQAFDIFDSERTGKMDYHELKAERSGLANSYMIWYLQCIIHMCIYIYIYTFLMYNIKGNDMMYVTLLCNIMLK